MAGSTKKLILNITIVGVFLFLLFTIGAPFIVQIQLGIAEKLVAIFRWQKANDIYRKAVDIDPLDAELLFAYGNFLNRRSIYQKREISWLKKAEKIYNKALNLNPSCAEYALAQGRVQLAFFEIDNNKYNNKLQEGLGNLKKAVKNDPHGVNTLYSAAFTKIKVWNFLNKYERETVIEDLKKVLTQRYWYYEYIYKELWQYTKDFNILCTVTPPTIEANMNLYSFIKTYNLWQFRKRQFEAIDYYTKKEKPGLFLAKKQEMKNMIAKIKQKKTEETTISASVSHDEWQGKSENGKNLYKHGNMYWTGTMDAVIEVPEGKATIKIQAKGTSADDIWPYMIVELDGEEIGERYVNSVEWDEYDFEVRTDGGIKVLSVIFANDGGNKLKKEDRNLYIGEARAVSEK